MAYQVLDEIAKNGKGQICRAQSYTARGWKAVEVFVCRCPAHTFRPLCARLGGICYPTQDFQDYQTVAE